MEVQPNPANLARSGRYSRALFFGVVMGLRAAKVLYTKLTLAVLGAPMIFFETTPSGRILNRFTSDTEMIDFQLLMQASQVSPAGSPTKSRGTP